MSRRNLRATLAALFLIFSPCLVFAQNVIGGGVFGDDKPAGGGGSYTGPGDIVAAVSWWGLRGYSAAYSTGSNPAADLVDQAGGNPITINIKSDGTLDVAAISAWLVANPSITTIKVTKLYDQAGGANPMVQLTLATMPTLVLGPVTGLASNRPALVFSGAQMFSTSFASVAIQPLSLGAVAIRTPAAPAGGMVAGNVSGDAEMLFDTPANTATIFAGGVTVSQTETDGAWHAIHSTFTGGNGIVNVDGSSGSTAAVGTGKLPNVVRYGEDTFGNFLNGKMNEGGVWNIALSGTNMTNLSSNYHAYWGF